MADTEATTPTPTPSTITLDRATAERWRERASELDEGAFKANLGVDAIQWIADVDWPTPDDGIDPRHGFVAWIAKKLSVDLELLQEECTSLRREIGEAIDPPQPLPPSLRDTVRELQAAVDRAIAHGRDIEAAS